MRICNSCRYCEGYCAVFPAIERRTSFSAGDLNYLANLCHNCSECLYACQYAPPHEFGVDMPKLLSELRTESYRKYAIPGVLLNGIFTAILVSICIAGWLLLGRGAVFSHRVMVEAFGVVSLLIILIFTIGFVRFWRDAGEPLSAFFNAQALIQATKDSLSLRYLDGGGGGCMYPAETQSQSRRWMHHLTFYGFGLCFASTCTAAIDHYGLGLIAPYPITSAPVLLGASGGILLTIGTAGLLALKLRRNPETQAAKQTSMDIAFVLMLLFSGVSGLALLALRETHAMPKLLAVHLGIVFALFLTLPYGKFVHAIYRSAALVKYALEGQRGIRRS
jgi:citrate/tricarballylate utilization protein